QAGSFRVNRARRALWRSAAARVITPLATVRSSTDTAERYAASPSGRRVAERTVLSAERIRDRAAMLRRRAFSLVTMRLAADLWCGMNVPPWEDRDRRQGQDYRFSRGFRSSARGRGVCRGPDRSVPLFFPAPRPGA